ncbi:MAG: hypothetical protein NTY12_03265 [Candidatus Falkowbacteria bacterium]|nr:hypothetical protein [Candidatus Falkowbacteria bacterium]
MLTMVKVSIAQTPYDSLYGACPEGVYFREDVVDLCSKVAVQSILIGGSPTNWILKEAKLYGDPNNPSGPGYYVLRTSRNLKVGKTVIIYAQVDKETWLPAALESFDIISETDLVDNGLTGKEKSFNIKVKVNNNIRFNFTE